MIFQDAWNLDLERLKRCYICEVDSDYGMVPFCAYNLTNSERNIFIQKVKRSNIDAMICKQEGITEITRDEIHRIQLEKLNIVLKKEKKNERVFYRDLPERLESLIDLRSLPFTTETDLARDGGRMLLCSQGKYRK